jgi:hypothetical protein
MQATPSQHEQLRPGEGYAYCYCPTCGNLLTVPSQGSDDLPWCVHHDGRYVWKTGGPESGWTAMRPAVAYPHGEA